MRWHAGCGRARSGTAAAAGAPGGGGIGQEHRVGEPLAVDLGAHALDHRVRRRAFRAAPPALQDPGDVGETGREKGSWKGGTIGTSIEMLPGELHESAFRRYCDEEHRAKSGKYRIKFIGAAA